LDFGPLPPSNRFETSEARNTDVHPLVIGQCQACGLVQLVDPMPATVAKSRFDWLIYNEPEGHLDDLVTRLCRLPGIDRSARIVGLSHKDDSTLSRFNALAYANTYRFDMRGDFGIADSCAGLESIQAALKPPLARELAARHGHADMLLVRDVLGHAHEPLSFLAGARELVRAGGVLAFEMPDCTRSLQAGDYSFVWEEHITYVSGGTLAGLLNNGGLSTIDVVSYPYPLEHSLIGVARNEAPGAATTPSQPDALFVPGAEFERRFQEQRGAAQSLFAGWRRDNRRVAIFGAGHMAAKFLNLYGLGELVECMIDDHPRKKGLLMPGSRVPIRGSEGLGDIDICLLALNPDSEQKVLARHAPFIERGGTFLSIFALNPQSLYNATS
jgi:hypothetical protein